MTHILLPSFSKKPIASDSEINSLPSLVGRSNIDTVPVRNMAVTVFNSHSYKKNTYTNSEINVSNIPKLNNTDILWVHFDGLADSELLHQLLRPFAIHDLVIEDILSHKQRPKIEDYGHYLFLATRVFNYKKHILQADQVYLIMGEHYILTFQDKPLGLFSIISDYLEQNRFDIKNKAIDFFAYTFIDRIMDDYFIVLESYSNKVEKLDNQIFDQDSDNMLKPIYQLRADAMRMRRALLPQREILHQLVRGDFTQFTESTHMYLRDVYDHSLQLMESLDSTREIVMGMMDIHLSFQSNRLNQQMRVLTVITIIFMPLTVITGIYGMNFDNMPELHWHYGYFMVLGFMTIIIVSLLTYFARRKWL